MKHTTETVMASIEENTGHPIEYWTKLIRKSGFHEYEEIVKFLVKERKLNPVLAEFIAEKAKGSQNQS